MKRIERGNFLSLFLLMLLILCLGARPKRAEGAPSKAAPQIALTDGVRTIVRRRSDLGIAGDGKGHTVIDQARLKRALAQIAAKFHQEPVDARPYVFRNYFRISSGKDGRALNVPETAGRITAILGKHPGHTRFSVVETKSAPVLTAARLKGVTGVLSRFETYTSENPKRDHNIAVAAQRINGTLLSPGETFSLNKTVGKRTHAEGFLQAHVFENAKVVEGIGGGVSQVTGTLFNAAALAGLGIVEVHPHSRSVAYLPLGRDATVAYGAEDLKFTNNTHAPVYVEYVYTNRSHLRAVFYGAKVPGKTVSLRPHVQKLGPGKVNAELYRVTKKYGRVVAKERLFAHKYRWDAQKTKTVREVH